MKSQQGKNPMSNPQLPQNGETATERQRRREALLSYGHIFANAHRAAADSSEHDANTRTPRRSVQTENDA
jgi:hypothetical protein